jgi:hypothetical protein
MSARRKLAAALATGAVALGAHAGTADAGAREWKGAETFAPVTIAPDIARCGQFPRHVSARFVGSGIDTVGGPFVVRASGCLDTQANVLSDLEATDTYLRGGSIRIRPDDAVLHVDRATCVATNVAPVPFTTAGGSGAFANARGEGHYDLAFTLPTCVGPQQVVHIWFHGTIDAGRD